MAQCSSCQFQNMPGTTHCGRCGASLLLAKAQINVHPPRAPKWAKVWRKTPLWRFWYAVKQPVWGLARQFDVTFENARPSIVAALQLFVPGWPQLAASKVRLGWSLLGSYVLCWLLAAVCYGTAFGLLCISGLILVHAVALYEAVVSSSRDRNIRMSRFLLGCGVLGLFLYLPLFNLGPQLAAPLAIQVERAPLLQGDVLLANMYAYRWARPRVGDIVVYELNRTRTNGYYQGRDAVINLVGQRIDRVLAGPGQSIDWDGRSLTVDGQPTTLRPLNPNFSGLPLKLTIPPEHYLIFPSGDPLGGFQTNDQNMASMLVLIPLRSIQGRVYWRNIPWRRMGPIR